MSRYELSRPRTAVLAGAIFVEALGYGAIFGLIADIQDEYHFGNSALSFIASAAFPAALVGQLGLARFGDRGHTRRLLWIGLVTAAVGMVWFWLGTDLWEFVVARALVGLGSGTFIPAARRAMLMRDPDNPGEAVALAGVADIGGFLAGVPIAAGLKFVGEQLNVDRPIHFPFIVIAVLLAIVGPLASSIPEPPVSSEQHDAIRAVLRIPMARAGLAIAVGFSVTIGTLDAIAARYITDLGATDKVRALVLVALAVPLILFMPVAGRLVDRFGHIQCGVVALLVTAVVLFSYSAAHSIAFVAVLGTTQAMANSVVYTAGQAAVATATSSVGLTSSGQGAYEATSAIGGFTCAFIAPLLYSVDNTLPMWAVMSALTATAAVIAITQLRVAQSRQMALISEPHSTEIMR